jgi:hypothetical protein
MHQLEDPYEHDHKDVCQVFLEEGPTCFDTDALSDESFKCKSDTVERYQTEDLEHNDETVIEVVRHRISLIFDIFTTVIYSRVFFAQINELWWIFLAA